MPNRSEFLVSFLATNLLGAIFVPVNHRLTAGEVAVYERIAAPVCAVTTDGTTHLFTTQTINIDETPLLAATPIADAAGPRADDAVAILFTSGTTGTPKGATFTQEAFLTTARNSVAALELKPGDGHLVVSPLSFTGGILTSTQPILFSGGEMLLMPGFDIDDIFDTLHEFRPAIFMAVPSMLSLLAEHPRFEASYFSSLRYLGSGSAPAPLPLLEKYRSINVNIGHAYGLTEGGGLQTLLSAQEALTHHGTAGRPCVHMQVKIMRDGHEVHRGETGEIYVQSTACMREYWGDPASSDEVLKGGWVATGDLGSMDADSYLTIHGRLKEVIISGGINVYPAEVENVLSAHPGIAELAVIGTPSETFGETVTAAIVRRDPDMTAADVQHFCRGKLADFKIPKIVVFVETLPRTASGKVIKSALT